MVEVASGNKTGSSSVVESKSAASESMLARSETGILPSAPRLTKSGRTDNCGRSRLSYQWDVSKVKFEFKDILVYTITLEFGNSISIFIIKYS